MLLRVKTHDHSMDYSPCFCDILSPIPALFVGLGVGAGRGVVNCVAPRRSRYWGGGGDEIRLFNFSSLLEPCYSFRRGKVASFTSLPRPQLLHRVTELSASQAAVGKWVFKDMAEKRLRPGLLRWFLPPK